MTIFRNAIIFTTLELAACLTCSVATFAQSVDPMQMKAAVAGMSHEQIVQKYMSMALPKNMHVSEKWPNNFPLPKYSGNVLSSKFTYSTKGPPSASAQLTTRDSPQVVFSFYKDACERGGWAVRTPSAKAMANSKSVGKFFMLEAKKEKEHIELTCMGTGKKATMLGILWNKVR